MYKRLRRNTFIGVDQYAYYSLYDVPPKYAIFWSPRGYIHLIGRTISQTKDYYLKSPFPKIDTYIATSATTATLVQKYFDKLQEGNHHFLFQTSAAT